MVWDVLSVGGVQRRAESDLRHCCPNLSSQRKPTLRASQEIYGQTGEFWDEKHLGAQVLEASLYPDSL